MAGGFDAKAGQRSLDMMRWGLVPYWAKDIKVGFANINAKAEEIETKPAFRKAFEGRRCLVPVDSFYEWQKNLDRWGQPTSIALAGRGIMALAGLWENLATRRPASGYAASRSVTTVAKRICVRQLHNRMPVVLKPDAWPIWLGEEQSRRSRT